MIEKALRQRSDLLPAFPGIETSQKLADALASVCADSLTGGSEGRAVTVAEVFVDASLAAATGGEAGVTLPRVLRSVPTAYPRSSARARCE